ncbi:Transposase InsO and inactivated derivatives [Desulfonispora thiosulfatigenes DSM 11270]|uniref:Transposase InsO and inactivated derivatives n=2 Tax=Desulfonispora thiosulfatigenes TaxID=83661 RepID=A0A1W1UWY1_DESTI|nr:Transposase InsO and inactivated derivatives [Desulfonispora thiosulfatigenes DSM 11270]
MKNLGLFAVVFKKFRPQSSKPEEKNLPNLLKQDFKAQTINQKWVADITYIHTLSDGWCYLASIMDLASHKIIGYEFSRSMDSKIVTDALHNAMLSQGTPRDVIIHTDRGSQYLSSSYLETTDKYNVRRSYSAKGNPYDNAVIESFHSILKKEEVYQKTYLSFEQAKLALFEYIEGWYNRNRIHGSIGFMTPDEFEKSVA